MDGINIENLEKLREGGGRRALGCGGSLWESLTGLNSPKPEVKSDKICVVVVGELVAESGCILSVCFSHECIDF